MKLAPSLLSADFGNLREEARQVEGLASYFHIDVMDGHFVPNLTIGPPVVNSLRQGLHRPLDIHLMIDHPTIYAPRFEVTSTDFIVFHIESKDDPTQTIEVIRKTDAQIGVSLRPGTSLEAIFPYLDQVDLVLIMSVEPGFGGQAFMPASLDRIRTLRQRIGDHPIEIAVDGGIDIHNIHSVVEAGASLIVVGRAIFEKPDRLMAMRDLLEAAE